MDSENKISKETMDKWHSDPDNWKLKIFYYNKEDQRIFPPKRYGQGWTINLANPKSILVFVGLVVVFTYIIRYFKH